MRYLAKIQFLTWLLGGLFLTGPNLLAQVQGNAFLSSQSNHAGISVIFTNTSTSGASDTAFTQSDGSYSLNLGAGVYDVRMKSTGYQTAFYNQNQSVLITGTETLDSTTLLPGPVKYVSGSVSGTFFGDTIYIANGDLTVQTNTILTLEAGTELRFEPTFSLTVDGQISALGTQTDPILLTVQNLGIGSQYWGGILFTALPALSEFRYCVVEYAETLLEVNTQTFGPQAASSPRLIIQNSVFRHAEDAGLALYSTQPILVANNRIYDFGILGVSFAEAGRTSPEHYTIICNEIYNGDTYGIFTFSTAPDALISGNEVYNVNGIGIRVGRNGGGNVVVQNNVVRNVVEGIAESAVNSPLPTIIRNNVIFDNQQGITLFGDGGAIIQMNAVYNNNIGINQFNSANGTPSELSYNLISQNTTNYATEVNIPFAGVPIITNANGDSTDAYFNLDFAPQVDSTGYFPLINSPLINAGEPTFFDLDGTVRDIGLYLDSLVCWAPLPIALIAVLPGDANNDSVANAWDLLPLGVAYGQTGPVRPNASLTWTPQLAPDWGQSLPSGIDLKHADSDGNGIINSDDTLAIGLNYNFLQSGTMPTTGGGIPLFMDMPTVFNPGDTLEIPVILGTMDTMVNNLYGLAFSLAYDSSQVQPNSVYVVFDSSWVGTDDQDLLTIFHDDFNSAVLEVALVRNDGMEVSGFGQIARIVVVLDDDIAKKEIDFKLTWQAVDAIHQNQGAMTVSPKATDAVITISTANEELLGQNDIRFFPNPARQQVTVTRETLGEASQVRILDLTGKIQLSETMNAGQSQIILPVNKLARGVYLLQVQEPGAGTLNRKIVIEAN